MNRRIRLFLALLIGCAACRDATGPDDLRAPVPEFGGGAILGTVECTVEVAAELVECRTPAPAGGGVNRAILGLNQIKLSSSGNHWDTVAQTFSLNVTIQNLLAEPVGTPDGTIRAGLKVFHDPLPAVTAYFTAGDTGTVTVANADGYGNFTKPRQPYHFYDTILAPQQVSAPENWVMNVPRTVKTFRFVMKVFTPIPSEPKVPLGPPDGVPESVYAPAKISTDLAGMSGTYVRDVVTILFQPGTPQEERQAAVNAVNGTVVGGIAMPGGDGEYYVQIPDNGTATPLLNAITLLSGLPQVIGTGPEFIMDGSALSYLSPEDGRQFSSWQLRPEQADSANWGLEAIQAPYAWGCSVGSYDTRIAVVDRGFHLSTVRDVNQNMRRVRRDAGMWPDSVEHGAMVASVLGARGDNQEGMTGVMWKAGLEMYGTGADAAGMPTVNAAGKYVMRDGMARLMDAIASGAPIVNMSISMGWDHEPGSADDHRRVTSFYRRLKGWIRWQRLLGRAPLLVFAAGNRMGPTATAGRDAYWSGYPNLVQDFGDQVIAVAAAELTAQGGVQIGSFSASGSLVEIAAPGVAVGALNARDSVVQVQGTSFAAPMVTGVAGLLLTFDPSLSTSDLKDLLLAGAVAGGRRIGNPVAGGTIPVLNAYESLRIAAERPGAPLCGNRVWVTEGGKVYAERGVGGPQEQLFAVAPGSYWLGGMHGSHLRLYENAQEYDAVFRHTGFGWQMVPENDPQYDSLYWESGPVLNGQYGLSHDGDSTLIAQNSGGLRMVMQESATGAQRTVGTVPVPLGNTDSWSSECSLMYTTPSKPEGTCADSAWIGGGTSRYVPAYAYSPRGDTAVVTYTTGSDLQSINFEWYPCPRQDPVRMLQVAYYCREISYEGPRYTSNVYSVSPAGYRLLRTVEGVAHQVSIADGLSSDVYVFSESVLQTNIYSYAPDTTQLQNGFATAWRMELDTARSTYFTSCRAVFVNMETLQTATLPGCVQNGGSFAPNVAPGTPAYRPTERRRPRPTTLPQRPAHRRARHTH